MHGRHNMNFVNHHLDMIKVGVAAIAYFGVTLTDANEVLKFITGLLTAGYLIYKWRKDIKGK